MKKMLLLAALLIPAWANASLLYTFNYTELDNQVFTIDNSLGRNPGYITSIHVGPNEFELGFDGNPLYYSWDINLDKNLTNVADNFRIVGRLNAFYGIDASFNRPHYKTAVGEYNTATIDNFYYREEDGYPFLYDPQLNHHGWTLDLTLLYGDNYYYGDDIYQIAFGVGNSLTLTDTKYLVPEPLAAALFLPALALIGFRRNKRK
ncbi:hypothetical protein [Alteromonas sp. ASW11-130]|uniref:hypothetical protein n=1 Tax=Alteromonas sp. ASW11-130 TaxID=3015775 RepID=UPI0022420A89|nr:hypothetical protein [Alteromonas sp. ASW11-130]MCW8090638.1 hypothetical protein [Alteromonas sp. ASW11-130]